MPLEKLILPLVYSDSAAIHNTVWIAINFSTAFILKGTSKCLVSFQGIFDVKLCWRSLALKNNNKMISKANLDLLFDLF